MENLFRSVPKQTLIILASCILISSLASLQLVPVHKLVFSRKIWTNFELWRLYTSLFYSGTFSLSFLIHILLYFNSSKQMELQGSGQYLYFNLLNLLISIPSALFFNVPFLSDIHFQSLVYIECRRNREAKIAIFAFPVQISAAYLPYINLALNFSTGSIIGMILGHIYYFFEDIYPKLPRSRDCKYLSPPMFILNLADLLKL